MPRIGGSRGSAPGADAAAWAAGGRRPVSRVSRARAPGGIRTHTARGLRPRTLPVGLPGRRWRPIQGGEVRPGANLPPTGTLLQVSETHRSVVIAEDEALIRLDLKEMLEEEGYVVVGEAGDGAAAVELTTSLQPDLVILDIKMPILDGISPSQHIPAMRLTT